jgi:hypothetical protein
MNDSIHIDPESERIRKMSHGVIMERKETAVDVLAPNSQNAILYERELMREQMYHRKEYQPLGKSSRAGVVLPPFTQKGTFRFGKLTHKDEEVSKIMYPTIADNQEDPETYRRYVLSHKAYKPGEQKKHYGENWCAPEYKESVEQRRLANDGNRVLSTLYWKQTQKGYLFLTK